VRVVKPGGRAVISDFVNTRQYAAFYRSRGCSVTRRWFPFDTFPPLRIVVADKPAYRVQPTRAVSTAISSIQASNGGAATDSLAS
jgi:hypothetical protein